jgi:hypothetical protein
MIRILFALALLAFPAQAADPVYGFAFARPGMTLEDLRAVKLPDGHRLLCGGDKEERIAPRDRETITLAPEMARIGLIRCGVFARDEGGDWTARLLDLAGNPANFWLLLITDHDGRRRLAQINLRQRRESFATTVAAFTRSFGPPTRQDALSANWSSAKADITIYPSEPAGIYVFIVDNRLYGLMTERMKSKP